MKRAVTILILVAIGAAGVRAYDIDAYCRRASGERFEECRKEERSAREALERRKVSGRILERCEKKAKDAGGSYRVKADCIDDEIEILKFLDDGGTRVPLRETSRAGRGAPNDRRDRC